MKSRLYFHTAVVAVSLAVTGASGQVQKEQDTTTSVSRIYTTAPQVARNGGKLRNQALSVTTNGEPFIANWASTEDDKRVDLDLNRASLKDALKQLFDQAKVDFSIEGDAPDASITVHAKNVKFSTALDLITESAGVHWNAEHKDKKTHYTVGKSIKQSGFSWSSPYVLSTKGANGFAFSNKPLTLWTQPFSSGAATKLLQPKDAFATIPNIYTAVTSEQRSTFTCPHCKGQATVLRTHQQPKCPKCGRTFQSEWQFCPFDSSKRPPTPGAWKYCPLCGKEVNVDEPDRKRGSNEELQRRRIGTEDAVRKVVAMRYASAHDAVASLPKQTGKARIAATDDRTNSVIIVGPSADVERLASALIELDK